MSTRNSLRFSRSHSRPLPGWPSPKKHPAAWRTRPSRASVAAAEYTINPDVERFGYQRAGMVTGEIDSSHLVMLSHPLEVMDVIREGLEAAAGA
jgi:hypothetical protein